MCRATTSAGAAKRTTALSAYEFTANPAATYSAASGASMRTNRAPVFRTRLMRSTRNVRQSTRSTSNATRYHR